MARPHKVHIARELDVDAICGSLASHIGIHIDECEFATWQPTTARCKNCLRIILRLTHSGSPAKGGHLAKLRNTSITVTVDNVYGSTVETLSATLGRNQEFIDFRYPHTGDNVMILDGRVKPFDADAKYGGPRLIVGSRTMRRFIFTETGNSARPGDGQPYIANPSEFEAGANPQIAFGRPGATYAGPYPILTVEQSAS